MGKELLTDEISNANDGDSETSESPFPFSDVFEDAFPYYLSMGMSYKEYWFGDPSLVVAYRKAEDIRSHRKNWEMWMNGRYVYEAVMRLIPSLQLLKPREPMEYMNEPYPLTKEEYEERLQREEKKKQEEIKAKMKALADRVNAKHKQAEEEQNNG